MKHGKLKKLCSALFALCVLVVGAVPAMAVTYNLRADRSTITMPDGQVVPVWGFADDTAGPGSGTVTVPGPQLNVTPGGTLTVTLVNNLPVPVSLVIPGQTISVPASPINDDSVPAIDVPYNPYFPPDTFTAIPPISRVRSFAIEAAANGGTATYNFGTVKTGSFIYESGTSPSVQIPMGLYGALVVGPGATGNAYTPTANNPNTAYDRSQVLLFSDILARYDFGLNPPRFVTMNEDVDLNSRKTTLPYPLTITANNEIKSTLDYQPLYYLINGKSYPDTIAPQPVSSAVGAPTVPGIYAPFGTAGRTLLRIINASGKDLVPTIQGSYQDNADPALSATHSLYPQIIAEDGNLYPYPKQEFAPILPAGKTLDVMIDLTGAAQPGYYTLYDRRLGLTNAGSFPGGMLTFLASWDPTSTNTKIANCSPFKGDINGDGRIDGRDALLALQAVVFNTNIAAVAAGDITPLYNGLPCGGDDGTGNPKTVLSLADALLILQKGIGLNPY
jgi:FtsP/CotA-like multicopper oxidase with cupredoxin domain